MTPCTLTPQRSVLGGAAMSALMLALLRVQQGVAAAVQAATDATNMAFEALGIVDDVMARQQELELDLEAANGQLEAAYQKNEEVHVQLAATAAALQHEQEQTRHLRTQASADTTQDKQEARKVGLCTSRARARAPHLHMLWLSLPSHALPKESHPPCSSHAFNSVCFNRRRDARPAWRRPRRRPLRLARWPCFSRAGWPPDAGG